MSGAPPPTRPPLIGLVRAVDYGKRRHTYGFGAVPPGTVTGELGSLLARAPDDAVPVWVTELGLLATPNHQPRVGRASSAEALRWALGPASWRVHPRSARARAVARRASSLPRRRSSSPAQVQPAAAGGPVGYLHREGAAGRRPLFSALHPVTGDQLLTSSPREAREHGYGEPLLLGHMVSAAPVTGAIGLTTAAIPWARRFGHAFGGAHESGIGAIDFPAPGQAVNLETLRVAGWALGKTAPVARVEIFLDALHVGRARLGLPRSDLLRYPPAHGHPAAWLAGFELWAAGLELPSDAHPPGIQARVETTDGEEFILEASKVEVARAEAPSPARELRGRQLRARVEQIAGARESSRSPSGMLVFAHRLDHGGAQRYLFEQVRRLLGNEFERCTVVALEDGYWREPLEACGAYVHVTSSYPVTGPDEYEGRLAELASWCAGRQFDVAFVNTLESFIGADLAARLGIPVVWALHESVDLPVWWARGHGGGLGQDYVLERAKAALRAAEVVVFAAEATCRLFEPYVGAGRTLVAPYGLELAEIDAFRRSFDREAERARRGLRPEDRVLLSLGILDPRKAHAVLAQAFATVASDHPDARLFIVGDVPGVHSDSLRGYLEAAGLESRCQLVPATEGAYGWHGIADVFVLASDIESSPIAILEAMAFQTPVLATGVFGVPELLEDGSSGFLCEPNDIESLASGLDRVLSMDPAVLAQVARAGAERTRERHDPERYAAALGRVVRELAGRSQALEAAGLDAPR